MKNVKTAKTKKNAKINNEEIFKKMRETLNKKN